MTRSVQQDSPELKPGEVDNLSLVHKVLKGRKKKKSLIDVLTALFKLQYVVKMCTFKGLMSFCKIQTY